MAITTTLAQAQNSVALRQEYWDARLLKMITLEQENFVFSNLGRDVTVPYNQGTIVYKVRRYNPLPVRGLSSAGGDNEKLAEGAANNSLVPEVQTVSATLDQFGAWMELTDRVADIHMDDIKKEYMPELARHAAEVKERVVISKFADASVNWVGSFATDYALLKGAVATPADGVLTMKELRKAALFQKVNKRGGHSKFGGKPVAVIHPYVMADLLDDADLKDRLLVPGNENGPIKSGTLQNYQFYGMFVQETLIAESRSALSVLTAASKTAATLVALEALTTSTVAVGDVYYATTPKKFYKCATASGSASTWTEIAVPSAIYTSYVLGRDPYVVVKLGDGAVSWHSTGFQAEKTDPLAQKATFGYKMWVGAKVIDPIAIIKVYSTSQYDVTDYASFSFDHDNNGGTSAITTDVWAAPATQS